MGIKTKQIDRLPYGYYGYCSYRDWVNEIVHMAHISSGLTLCSRPMSKFNNIKKVRVKEVNCQRCIEQSKTKK